jgi:hypothetical protein
MSIFRHKSAPVVTPDYTGMQIQTSSNALPVPIVYGINRMAPNLIWHDNFQSHPQYSNQSGGKGGGSHRTVSGYTFSSAIMLGIGEGPITAIGTIWKGQSLHTPASLNLSLFNGTTPQNVWSYLTTAYPDAVLTYQGTAFACAPDFDLGSGASLGTLNFEIYGILYTSSLVNAHDADPAQVIGDFLTNAQYGIGFPAASIDATTLYGASGDASYQTYCCALGLGFSPCLTDQENARGILQRWLALTNTAAVWSAGKLKFIPFGDEPNFQSECHTRL